MGPAEKCAAPPDLFANPIRPPKTENQSGIDRGIEMKALMSTAASDSAAVECLLEQICRIGRNSQLPERQLDGILVRAVRVEIDNDDDDVDPVRGDLRISQNVRVVAGLVKQGDETTHR